MAEATASEPTTDAADVITSDVSTGASSIESAKLSETVIISQEAEKLIESNLSEIDISNLSQQVANSLDKKLWRGKDVNPNGLTEISIRKEEIESKGLNTDHIVDALRSKGRGVSIDESGTIRIIRSSNGAEAEAADNQAVTPELEESVKNVKKYNPIRLLRFGGSVAKNFIMGQRAVSFITNKINGLSLYGQYDSNKWFHQKVWDRFTGRNFQWGKTINLSTDENGNIRLGDIIDLGEDSSNIEALIQQRSNILKELGLGKGSVGDEDKYSRIGNIKEGFKQVGLKNSATFFLDGLSTSLRVVRNFVPPLALVDMALSASLSILLDYGYKGFREGKSAKELIGNMIPTMLMAGGVAFLSSFISDNILKNIDLGIVNSFKKPATRVIGSLCATGMIMIYARKRFKNEYERASFMRQTMKLYSATLASISALELITGTNAAEEVSSKLIAANNENSITDSDRAAAAAVAENLRENLGVPRAVVGAGTGVGVGVEGVPGGLGGNNTELLPENINGNGEPQNRFARQLENRQNINQNDQVRVGRRMVRPDINPRPLFNPGGPQERVEVTPFVVNPDVLDRDELNGVNPRIVNTNFDVDNDQVADSVLIEGKQSNIQLTSAGSAVFTDDSGNAFNLIGIDKHPTGLLTAQVFDANAPIGTPPEGVIIGRAYIDATIYNDLDTKIRTNFQEVITPPTNLGLIDQQNGGQMDFDADGIADKVFLENGSSVKISQHSPDIFWFDDNSSPPGNIKMLTNIETTFTQPDNGGLNLKFAEIRDGQTGKLIGFLINGQPIDLDQAAALKGGPITSLTGTNILNTPGALTGVAAAPVTPPVGGAAAALPGAGAVAPGVAPIVPPPPATPAIISRPSTATLFPTAGSVNYGSVNIAPIGVLGTGGDNPINNLYMQYDSAGGPDRYHLGDAISFLRNPSSAGSNLSNYEIRANLEGMLGKAAMDDILGNTGMTVDQVIEKYYIAPGGSSTPPLFGINNAANLVGETSALFHENLDPASGLLGGDADWVNGRLRQMPGEHFRLPQLYTPGGTAGTLPIPVPGAGGAGAAGAGGGLLAALAPGAGGGAAAVLAGVGPNMTIPILGGAVVAGIGSLLLLRKMIWGKFNKRGTNQPQQTQPTQNNTGGGNNNNNTGSSGATPPQTVTGIDAGGDNARVGSSDVKIDFGDLGAAIAAANANIADAMKNMATQFATANTNATNAMKDMGVQMAAQNTAAIQSINDNNQKDTLAILNKDKAIEEKLITEIKEYRQDARLEQKEARAERQTNIALLQQMMNMLQNMQNPQTQTLAQNDDKLKEMMTEMLSTVNEVVTQVINNNDSERKLREEQAEFDRKERAAIREEEKETRKQEMEERERENEARRKHEKEIQDQKDALIREQLVTIQEELKKKTEELKEKDTVLTKRTNQLLAARQAQIESLEARNKELIQTITENASVPQTFNNIAYTDASVNTTNIQANQNPASSTPRQGSSGDSGNQQDIQTDEDDVEEEPAQESLIEDASTDSKKLNGVEQYKGKYIPVVISENGTKEHKDLFIEIVNVVDKEIGTHKPRLTVAQRAKLSEKRSEIILKADIASEQGKKRAIAQYKREVNNIKNQQK